MPARTVVFKPNAQASFNMKIVTADQMETEQFKGRLSILNADGNKVGDDIQISGTTSDPQTVDFTASFLTPSEPGTYTLVPLVDGLSHQV